MPVEIRKMPIRSKEIELSGEWAGWKFTGRINPPMQSISDIMSGRYDLIIAGLTEVVLTWNFTDENGNPLPDPAEIRSRIYPPPTDKDGNPIVLSYEEVESKRKKDLYRLIGKIPLDLAVAMSSALGDAVSDVNPN